MTNEEAKKIDGWEIQGKNAELWSIKDNLQVRYLGTIHNIPLSSVTPKEKTGHWYIRETYPLECNSWECSECKEVVYEKTKYCPNCGARMVSE